MKTQLQDSYNQVGDKYYISGEPVSLSVTSETGTDSNEYVCLNDFIRSIDYEYALQGDMERLENFRQTNQIDETKYPIIHQQIIYGLARGGHLSEIYAYIKRHHLNIKDFNCAIIKGLAAVGPSRIT